MIEDKFDQVVDRFSAWVLRRIIVPLEKWCKKMSAANSTLVILIGIACVAVGLPLNMVSGKLYDDALHWPSSSTNPHPATYVVHGLMLIVGFLGAQLGIVVFAGGALLATFGVFMLFMRTVGRDDHSDPGTGIQPGESA